jgi:hypothetical protein
MGASEVLEQIRSFTRFDASTVDAREHYTHAPFVARRDFRREREGSGKILKLTYHPNGRAARALQ